MPLYEYQCGHCGRFEIIHKFSDPPLPACPTCGGEVEKLPSSPAIQFKGTGWYVTDYGRKSSGGDGKKDGEKSSAGGEAKAGSGDAKGDSKDSSGGSGTSTSKDSPASGGTTPAK